MTSDEQAIRAAHAAWVDAVNAGDLEQLLALMTDDVVFVNPGQEPFGRDGFPARTAGHRQFGEFVTLARRSRHCPARDRMYARHAHQPWRQA